jgi:cytoskeletal protein CcmA (bactofilin family)
MFNVGITAGSFHVTGASNLIGNLNVSAASAFNGGITAGCLNITGDSILNGNVTAGAMHIIGTSVLNGAVTAGALFVTGASLFIGNMTVSGGSTFNGGLTAGSLNITGSSVLNGSVTAGALFITGASTFNTANVTASVTIGNYLVVNTVNLTPSTGDIFQERVFNADNNIVYPEDITGFAFSNTVVRSFEAIVSASVIATNNQYAIYKILGIQKDNHWYINTSYVGDSLAGISFSITDNGQLQYTSLNQPGWVSTTIKFRGYMTTSV